MDKKKLKAFQDDISILKERIRRWGKTGQPKSDKAVRFALQHLENARLELVLAVADYED